ncbi:MAG: hypothetical protein JSS51_14570 [Planctomycetes bacterium]|nr:hypothetical protein [Planctomycetota bacterium]
MIDRLYREARATPSDINEHLELLARLSSLCETVTEFGTRQGTSTVALIFGRPKAVRSYDIVPLANERAIARAAEEAGVSYTFEQADDLKITIEPTDLLFIDTLHTYDQLRAELALHADKARRYIAFHDTSTFGDVGGGEAGDPEAARQRGLWPAIAEFLRAHREWRLQFLHTHNNGLTVIERV